MELAWNSWLATAASEVIFQAKTKFSESVGKQIV